MKHFYQRVNKSMLPLVLFSITLLSCYTAVLLKPVTTSVASLQDQHSTVSNQAEPIVDEIITLLDACPAWSDISTEDTKTPKVILEHSEKIAVFDLDMIRKAIQKYVKEKQKNAATDVGYWSRVYVLNRYLFKAPESANFDEGTFGGWDGPPPTNGKLNWLWPLSYGEGNKLELTGHYRGYFGHNYLAVMEFDYFRKNFGPRKSSNK